MSAPTTFGSTADFMSGGSRYPKPVAWDNLPVGTRVGGIIVEDPEVTQVTDVNTRAPRTFDDGSPMLQMAVIIDTGNADPAVQGDDGRRTLMIRGGFKYESSKKALADALKPHGLVVPRVGDHIVMTRIPNRTGAGLQARTHQFSCEYTVAENLSADLKEQSEAAPKKRAARKPAAAAAAPATAAVTDPWDDGE